MNITLLCIFPNYFNATGLCQALEDHCGHTVTQFVNVHKPQDFYHWPVHHRHCALHDMVSLKESLSQSDLVIVCGAMVFLGWQTHSKLPAFKEYTYASLDDFWADIPDTAKTAMIVSDSAILEQDWTDTISRFDTVFAMPDLFDYVKHPNLYPALQANEAFQWPTKPRPHRTIQIGHSPGNKEAKNRKGTRAIIKVMGELLRDGFRFQFSILAGLSHEECVKAKQEMDIFIDQLQDPPQSPVGKGMKPFLGALGKSGQEAMCNGCATITSGNLVSTEPYFPNPPVIIANTKAMLKYEIANLLRHPHHRYNKAQEQYAWAKQYLSPEFVSYHIMRCINGATTPQTQRTTDRADSGVCVRA